MHNFSLPLLLFGDVREAVDNNNWIRKIVLIVVQTVEGKSLKKGVRYFSLFCYQIENNNIFSEKVSQFEVRRLIFVDTQSEDCNTFIARYKLLLIPTYVLFDQQM